MLSGAFWWSLTRETGDEHCAVADPRGAAHGTGGVAKHALQETQHDMATLRPGEQSVAGARRMWRT